MAVLPDRFRLRYFLSSQAPARVHRDIQSTSRPFGASSVGAQAAASEATATPYVRVAFFAFGRLKTRKLGTFESRGYRRRKRKLCPCGRLSRLVKYKGSHPAGAQSARRRDGGT